MRDFLNILQQHRYYKDDRWNKSDHIYTFETGSTIEFFSADQPDKVRGPRRDRLFINEANNIPYEAFDQLEIRTKDFIFLDYNPTNEFWAFTELANRPDKELVILTYKDNEALDKRIVEAIELRKQNKNWWTVYGEGQLGVVEGRIFKDWQIIDDIPHEARIERYGLDFGYTNDPTAIVAVYKLNGGFILDEVCYQRGMSNRHIADVLNALERKAPVYADSAEPKSIDEIKTYGVNIFSASKGPGSLLQGIQFIQDQRISVTKQSTNLIKEYRNYLWETGSDGKPTNTPESGWDHALDATRYAFSTMKPTPILADFIVSEPEMLYPELGI